jgi:D-glycero-beta-D-manno-heptose 1-phosphate adenylyltransferase
MRYPQESWKAFSKDKIFSAQDVVRLLAPQRARGKTVGLLNGSFDLLHAGHLYILYEASRVADILVVALNTDESIKRYKSQSRPIISLQDRLEMVSALSFVDYVTWFAEDDPCQLIHIIRPDVHVNGIEYGRNCIEASSVKECGGRLHLVERIPGLATSTVIKTIQNLCDESPSQAVKTK